MVTCNQNIIPESKKGKLMAGRVSVCEPDPHLGKAKGWLENDDPFFDIMNQIVQNRSKHVPSILKGN